MTTDILRHSETTKWVKNLFRQYLVNSANKQIPKRVRNDKQFPVTLNCLEFCFTKSRYSLLFAVVRLTFCSFVSALSLRTTQNPLISGSILKDTSAKASVWREIFRVILRSERPKNLFYSKQTLIIASHLQVVHYVFKFNWLWLFG